MGKVFYVFALAVGVAACSNPWAGYRPSEAERIRSDWYQSASPALEARYCYRTLARVDCFAEPQLGESQRRVDSFHASAN